MEDLNKFLEVSDTGIDVKTKLRLGIVIHRVSELEDSSKKRREEEGRERGRKER